MRPTIPFLRRHTSVLAGGLALALSLSAATCVGCQTLKDPFDVSLEAVRARPDGLSVDVHIDLTLIPHARARFLSIDGDLRIQGQSYPFSIEGLTQGDLLHANQPRQVSVKVDLSGLDVAQTLLLTVGSGNLKVTFEGIARVKVLGLTTSIPVQVDREVGL